MTGARLPSLNTNREVNAPRCSAGMSTDFPESINCLNWWVTGVCSGASVIALAASSAKTHVPVYRQVPSRNG